MKNLIKHSGTFLVLLLLMCFTSYAQSPDAFSYQTVVRDDVGNIIPNQEMMFRFSIIEDSITGIAFYVETHDPTSNEFGIVNLEIGRGYIVAGDFSLIPWGTSEQFLKIEIDPTGGANYIDMGTTELLSVPYAFYADEAGNVNYNDTSSVNELQQLSINGNEISLTQGGGTITIPDPIEVIPDTLNPIPIKFRGEWRYVLPYDLADTIYWGENIQTSAVFWDDGEMNTSIIIAVSGSGNYAAYLCDTLNAFGYDDWYLPSIEELTAMFAQSYLLNIDYKAFGSANNGQWDYWSSTEKDINYTHYAWGYNSRINGISALPKTTKSNCRCIRK